MSKLVKKIKNSCSSVLATLIYPLEGFVVQWIGSFFKKQSRVGRTVFFLPLAFPLSIVRGLE